MGQPQTLESIFTSHGIVETVRLALDLAHTKTRFPGARIVRRPAYVRGWRWMRIGRRFSSGPGLRLDAEGKPRWKGVLLRIGDDVSVNDHVHIGAAQSVTIGNRVLIASKVFISDHNHGSYGLDGVHSDPRVPPRDRPLSAAPVVIEDDVWLGEFVAVLPGVRIGKGSIVGTMSTVTKDIPPYSIAVGSPARVVKQYNFETQTWDRV